MRGVCAHPMDCHPHRAPVRHWVGTWRAPTMRASCQTITTATTTLTRESSRTSPARQDWYWGAAPSRPSPAFSWRGTAALGAVGTGPCLPHPTARTSHTVHDATGAASAPALEQPPRPFCLSPLLAPSTWVQPSFKHTAWRGMGVPGGGWRSSRCGLERPWCCRT